MGIRSFALPSFAQNLLVIVRLWAICSCSSVKKSNCEQNALITLYKSFMQANRSHRSLKKSAVSDSRFCSQKKNYSLKTINIFHHVFDSFSQFFLFMPMSESLQSLFALSLFFKEQWEQFALIALYRRATVSESLQSLFTKEWPKAICSFPKGNRYFALYLQKTSDSLFAHNKTSDSLEKPKSKISTLQILRAALIRLIDFIMII